MADAFDPDRAEAALDVLIALVREEVEAIHAGDLQAVADLYPRKRDKMEHAETLLRGLAPVLADAPHTALRAKVATLKELVAEDERLLARVTEATGEVAAELRRIRDRHGLGGLYGRGGQRRDPGATPRARLDQSF
ncbi:hypothetical protein [Tranquillimonas alkanivorans]|uniref:FlgN protein n=1 Tax=Tranquillimonas alkanivorans TaxID=441119 RepID=A0A1I5S4E0_9RHOB|nr:hypothetical protein [Tranquillimonas alkanivorans]SFP65643.1 hypothetical protein SAMN04488047_11038 [Tranquillimonas alkanivorans]